MKKNSKLRINFRAPLNPEDTEVQTYGCRANNPDICRNCYIEGICAFTNDDSICKRPSAAWKKQYMKMKERL